MTNIPREIVQKALDNGFKPSETGNDKDQNKYMIDYETSGGWVFGMYVQNKKKNTYTIHFHVDSSKYQLIFDHEFAKALFGRAWKRHLKKLAVTEDRIKYLKENS